jgi:cytochrome c
MRVRFLILSATLLISVAQAQGLDAKRAGELMAKAGCNACHQMEKKVLGPSYKDVAAKYKSNAKAPELLAKKVRDGGMGVWGPIPMPPHPKEKIGDDDLKQMIAWIMTLN